MASLIVIQVGAKALDEQLYQAFVSARWLVGDVTQAATIKDLRAKLQNAAGQVVFTTLPKFDLLDRPSDGSGSAIDRERPAPPIH